MVLGLWEVAETLEVAEIFIRWALSMVKLVDEEKNPKKYPGALNPKLKDNNPKQPIQQRPKGQK